MRSIPTPKVLRVPLHAIPRVVTSPLFSSLTHSFAPKGFHLQAPVGENPESSSELTRERLLQMRLHELQIELENLVWNRKELEERLQMAIKECRMMEAMLTELEDDHDQAIVKIELLESELQDVIKENLRLKEIQGKRLRSFQSQVDAGKGNNRNNEVTDRYGSYGMPSWKSSFDGSGVILEDLLIHKDAWEEEREHKADSLDFMRTELKVSGPSHAVPPGISLSRNLNMNEVLGKRREVALSQSFFSAVLSLLVGMIIWEAEDPCMPLVVALFTVVAMSLKSVVQFFCTIKNKLASDAVALLSFNWFMLGTLAYPMLPKIACMLTPTALSFLEWTATSLESGVTFSCSFVSCVAVDNNHPWMSHVGAQGKRHEKLWPG
ncbi:unnamed protein product [Camellia sinensis]